MKINDKVKKYRIKNGYTQKNIADFLHVDQSYISEVEDGRASLTSDMIHQLASLFCIQDSSFLSENDDNIHLTTYTHSISDLTPKDLETIALINRIALNANYMETISS